MDDPTTTADTDELYIPFVPHHDQDQEEADPHIPTREELRARTPPPGMRRRDRKDWNRNEAVRVAALQDAVPGLRRRRDLPAGPPRGIGRAGRKAWREENRDLKAARRRREDLRTRPQQAVGALLLAVAAAAACVWFWMPGGDDDQPQAPDVAAARSAEAADTVITRERTPKPPGAARQALTAWLDATCDVPAQHWGEDVHAMMTEQGWAQRDQTRLVVEPAWVCTDVQVFTAAEQPGDGTWAFRWEANRQVTLPGAPPATEHAEGRRVMVPAVGGTTWLVDAVPAE